MWSLGPNLTMATVLMPMQGRLFETGTLSWDYDFEQHLTSEHVVSHLLLAATCSLLLPFAKCPDLQLRRLLSNSQRGKSHAEGSEL